MNFIKLNINNRKILFFFSVILCFCFISCEEELEVPVPESVIISPISSRNYNSITLSWSLYEDEYFDRYEVYYKKSSDKDFILYVHINDAKTTSVTIYGIDLLYSYDIFIRTVDKSGKYSDSKIVTFGTEFFHFTGIKLVNITEITYNSVRLTWTKYIDEAIIPFEKYYLFYIVGDQFPNKLYDSINIINDTSRIVHNLIEKSVYSFRVLAVTAYKVGFLSQGMTVKTLPKPPDTVKLYEPTEFTENSVNLKWTKSKDKDITQYEIHISENGSDFGFTPTQSTKFAEIKSLDITSYQFTGFKKNYEYFSRIVTIDSDGVSSNSNFIAFTTTLDGLPVPVNISGVEITTNRVILLWTESPSRYFISYEIHKSKIQDFIPDNTTARGVVKDRQISRFEDSNFEKNTIYYYKIIVNAHGKSSTSKGYKITTLP